jgi:hypothetical protein
MSRCQPPSAASRGRQLVARDLAGRRPFGDGGSDNDYEIEPEPDPEYGDFWPEDDNEDDI